MRIVDVCAFYSPHGGGVRTYVDAKLRAASALGHEMVVFAPGEQHEVIERHRGGIIVTLPGPVLPVDRRYRYFNDERLLHAALDEWRPDHVEASSPWSSATMVGRWQGAATRSLVMHSDPLSAYAYRWLGGILERALIDRACGWFWRHLRGLGAMFDLVVCANADFAQRLEQGGIANATTVPMGVEPGLFSPELRSPKLRASTLEALGLGPDCVLFLGVGRFSAEKRWEMVARAIGEGGRRREAGLVLVGEGPGRWKLDLMAQRFGNVAVVPRIADRRQLARFIASVDAVVHGCEAETFCMVAAEARASGVPLIVPDRGAALDQSVHGAGRTFRAGSERSLEKAIDAFIDHGPEFQRAIAARAARSRTMDEHFSELFSRYSALAPERELAAPRVAKLAPAAAFAL